MKKQILFLIGSLCISYTGFAQSGIISTGVSHAASGAGESVSYTVGQIDYAHASGGNGTAYAGLQQPFEISDLTDVKNIGENIKMKLYPNPAQDKIILENVQSSNNLLKAKLINSEGKEITVQALNGTNNEIDISSLVPGAYLVEIKDQNENKLKTYSIIKK